MSKSNLVGINIDSQDLFTTTSLAGSDFGAAYHILVFIWVVILDLFYFGILL